MRWIEIIEVRTTAASGYKLAAELQNLNEKNVQPGNSTKIRIFSRPSLDCDFCIYLEHDVAHLEKDGSQLGVRLADALKAYGLINHKIWMEISS